MTAPTITQQQKTLQKTVAGKTVTLTSTNGYGLNVNATTFESKIVGLPSDRTGRLSPGQPGGCPRRLGPLTSATH